MRAVVEQRDLELRRPGQRRLELRDVVHRRRHDQRRRDVPQPDDAQLEDELARGRHAQPLEVKAMRDPHGRMGRQEPLDRAWVSIFAANVAQAARGELWYGTSREAKANNGPRRRPRRASFPWLTLETLSYTTTPHH